MRTRQFRRCDALVVEAIAIALAVTTACGGPTTPIPVPGPSAPAPDASDSEPDPEPSTPILTEQSSGVSARLQAISAVSAEVVWASGVESRVLGSADAGKLWQELGSFPVTHQFRDIHAADASRAWLLASGVGSDSAVYATVDGGRNWTSQLVNQDPDGFYDCLAFWNDEVGIVFGDSVPGGPVLTEPHFGLLRTGDGGKRWQQLPLSAIPAPQAGEVAFAASGTCATTAPDGRGWIVTGNATQPRILSTQDFGETWTAQGVAAPGGEGIGLTSIAFESGPNPQRGIVVGGVIVGEDDSVPTVLVTSDGGATWQRQPSETVPFDGPLYGVAVAPEGPVAVAVGPQGAIWSSDRGVRQGSEITYAC